MTYQSIAPETAHLLAVEPSELSDQELAKRTRAGDRASYAELWRRHAAFAGNAAAGVVAPADIDDLVAESFTRIYERIRNGGGPRGEFRPYLYVSIRNLAIEWGRARREHTAADEEWFARIPAAADREESGTEDEYVLVAFQALPDRWKQALWYSEVEELPLAETAARLNLTSNAASQLTFRAREALRAEWVQAHLPGDAVADDCRWAVERMGSYERGRLGKRDLTKFQVHIDECASCTVLVATAKKTGSRLRALLLPFFFGGGLTLWQLGRPASGAQAHPALLSRRPGGRTPARHSTKRARLATNVKAWTAAASAASVIAVISAVASMTISPLAHTTASQGSTTGPSRDAVDEDALDVHADADAEEPTSPHPAPSRPERSLPEGDTPSGGREPGSAPSPTVSNETPERGTSSASEAPVVTVELGVATERRGHTIVPVTVTNIGAAAANGVTLSIPAPEHGYYSIAGVWTNANEPDPNVSVDTTDAAATRLTLNAGIEAAATYTFSVVLAFDPSSWEEDAAPEGCQTVTPSATLTVRVQGPDGRPSPGDAATLTLPGTVLCEV